MKPPSDVCSLLTVSDVETVLADSTGGISSEGMDENAWMRQCVWTPPLPTSEFLVLTVFGAVTPSGEELLTKGELTQGGGTREDLTGLGEQAVYLENLSFGIVKVVAKSGAHFVEIASQRVDPTPTKDELVALVRTVLGKL